MILIVINVNGESNSHEEKKVIRKTAIVTGASSGIGHGIALVLAKNGYDISTVYCSNTEGIRNLADEIEGVYGRKLHSIRGDLSEPNFVKDYAKEAISVLGEVDLLVNNAGAGFGGRLTEIKTDEMIKFIHIDFIAPVLLMKAIGLHMLDKGIRGSMINITSTRAERAYPHDSIYGGMKAALTRASESAALEMAIHGIRINNIAPGATEIEKENREFYDKLGKKIPLRRTGKPEDIGEAVLWLASDAASYITGVSLRVDGGLILPGMPERDDETTRYYGWEPMNE
ncbi:SDR family NAD(P)-dependent oxidoreductase [Paenibacillus validus]|uniref:SDR family oxidoreductase n=1 Tax=Paenibacillus validus TaxID=44253 RepID=A0A7X3CU56_9BACL|nr:MULTISPECIES: SDR family oxidoreductase [Paenibacillus]MED4600680.1 SDR family NAD(P)-dependent oxidoreductase [Paenibacillus validus]MED4605319.1 SDR family NAD(P)-dependent oxidoreductase [Paenibacillus validus]MUG71787.1 SDR family oxidoreductase [Paenibacillus validus]